MEKVRAGHQVILLDPHAANHEWKGIRHIGAGMDYPAIAEFLQWYLDEIERRYQEFNRSGLTEGRLAAVVTAAAAHYQRGVGRNDELGRPTAG
jgi:hypothetical protein